MSYNTSYPQYKFAPFQSGSGTCYPSTDFKGYKGGAKKRKTKGGNPNRYFNPNSRISDTCQSGGRRFSVRSPGGRANIKSAADGTAHFKHVRQNQGKHAVEILSGGGTDWRGSQMSRTTQPIEFSWTDMNDFRAFTKTPYISPKQLVGEVMPPSAAPSTTVPTGFDPMGSDLGPVTGGGLLADLFGIKKRRKTKRKASAKKKTTKRKAPAKKRTTKRTTKRKAPAKKRTTKRKTSAKKKTTKRKTSTRKRTTTKRKAPAKKRTTKKTTKRKTSTRKRTTSKGRKSRK